MAALTVSREVVLHHERAVKAERLGFDVVVDEIAKPSLLSNPRPVPCRRTAEQAESHVVSHESSSLVRWPHRRPGWQGAGRVSPRSAG